MLGITAQMGTTTDISVEKNYENYDDKIGKNQREMSLEFELSILNAFTMD